MKYILLGLLMASSAFAGPDTEHWSIVRSAHFELYTSVGSEPAGLQAVEFFEQVHSMFASWHAKSQASDPRVRIIVFQSEKDYRWYQPNPMAAAFFQSGNRGDFIVMKNLSAESYPVAVHEYVHLVVKRSGLRMTTAMNEGLAEFYSTLKVSPKGIEIGTPPVARLWALRQSKLMPLPELLSVGMGSPIYHSNDVDRLAIFYAESWALTHMLLLSPEYRTKSASYARAMQAGPDPLTALERTTGKSAAQILGDLKAYVRRDRFVTALLDAKLDRQLQPPEVRPATRQESGMALADLLDNMGRHAEANERYEALARPESETRN
jgi:hypothetical protein